MYRNIHYRRIWSFALKFGFPRCAIVSRWCGQLLKPSSSQHHCRITIKIDEVQRGNGIYTARTTTTITKNYREIQNWDETKPLLSDLLVPLNPSGFQRRDGIVRTLQRGTISHRVHHIPHVFPWFSNTKQQICKAIASVNKLHRMQSMRCGKPCGYKTSLSMEQMFHWSIRSTSAPCVCALCTTEHGTVFMADLFRLFDEYTIER